MIHTQIVRENNSISWTMDVKSFLEYYMAQNNESIQDIVYAEFAPSWHSNFTPNSNYEPIWIGSWDDVMSCSMRMHHNDIEYGLESYAKSVESDIAYYIQECLLDYGTLPRVIAWTDRNEYQLSNSMYTSTGMIDYKELKRPIDYNDNHGSPYAGYIGWRTVVPQSN